MKNLTFVCSGLLFLGIILHPFCSFSCENGTELYVTRAIVPLYDDIDQAKDPMDVEAYSGNDGVATESLLTSGPLEPIPEPITFVLFGIGIIGLATLGRKKFKRLGLH